MELNVQESCINLFANPIVQKKQVTSSQPKIHGFVYDVANGLLKELEIDFKVCASCCVFPCVGSASVCRRLAVVCFGGSGWIVVCIALTSVSNDHIKI